MKKLGHVLGLTLVSVVFGLAAQAQEAGAPSPADPGQAAGAPMPGAEAGAGAGTEAGPMRREPMGQGRMGGGTGHDMMGAGRMGHGMMGRGMHHGMMGERHGMMGGMRMMMILVDTNSDGALSLEEVQTVHERFFRAIDADDDDRVTIEELQAFMHGEGGAAGAP